MKEISQVSQYREELKELMLGKLKYNLEFYFKLM